MLRGLKSCQGQPRAYSRAIEGLGSSGAICIIRISRGGRRNEIVLGIRERRFSVARERRRAKTRRRSISTYLIVRERTKRSRSMLRRDFSSRYITLAIVFAIRYGLAAFVRGDSYVRGEINR